MDQASPPEGSSRPLWKQIVIPLLSAVTGAIAATYAQSGKLYLIPAGSYQDLAAIMLGAVGVIAAIFGVVVAIAAFWGFAQMKQEAVRTACAQAIPAATVAALDHLKEQVGNGDIRNYIFGEVERLMQEELNSPRMAKRIEARVDQIVIGNDGEDRLLDNGAEETER
jgi:uncharacterized membrane protein